MNENSKAFSISYSGADNDELKKLKAKYSPSQKNEPLNEIRKLDKRVDFISTMISIGLGIIGSFLLVNGIIFIVKNPDKLMWGSVSAILGLLIASVVPMLHYKVLRFIKKRIGPRILELINDIESNNF